MNLKNRRAKKLPAKKPPPPPVKVLTVALTPENIATLQALAQEATDALGRTMGASSVVRALLQWAEQHEQPFATLLPFFEQNLNRGVRWGKAPKPKRTASSA